MQQALKISLKVQYNCHVKHELKTYFYFPHDYYDRKTTRNNKIIQVH